LFQVYNAIDAKASCVAIRVDLAQCKIQVIDNGHGIEKDDLAKIGSRSVYCLLFNAQLRKFTPEIIV
jgi:hypothetical protein